MGTIDALFSSTRSSILTVLYKQPRHEFYLREIVRLVEKGLGGVQRELKNLVNAEIIIQKRRAGRLYYRANSKCPIFPELRNIILKSTSWKK
jgi:predicted transcriptional regulator